VGGVFLVFSFYYMA